MKNFINKNFAKFRLSKTKTAFSLIELSVVLIIVALIVVGIFSGRRIITRAKLTSAQNLTSTSPINTTEGNILWLEAVMDKSFKSSEMFNNTNLSVWNNITPITSLVTTTIDPASAAQTYFENGINNLPSVKFDGATTNNATINLSSLNGTDYTIFVVEKKATAAGGYFIGDTTLLLGYSGDGTMVHSQSGTTAPSENTNAYSANVPVSGTNSPARVFSFVQSSAIGKRIFLDGTQLASSSDKSQLSGITNIVIGKVYTGQIGEIAIFNRALKEFDRRNIEDYLSRKWNRPIAPLAANGKAPICDVRTAAGLCYENVGNYNMSSGSYTIKATGVSSTATITVGSNKTCPGQCATLFNGTSTDYRCSTTGTSVTFTGYYALATPNSTSYVCSVQSDTCGASGNALSYGVNNATNTCGNHSNCNTFPFNGTNCVTAWGGQSTCSSVNYCFKLSQ